MKFGLLSPQGFLYGLPKDSTSALRKIMKLAEIAEELGFHSVWVTDHFIPFPFITSDNVLEAWTLLSFLASKTYKIRLGTLVTCNLYRFPTVLAKMASTLDVLSRGRLEFGIGACWYAEEFSRYGITYPRFSERIRMLDEALEIIKLSWTKREVNYHGKYYRVKGLIMEPKPIQKPHSPVVIGGSSKSILYVVAKHANKWNYMGEPKFIKKKYGFIRKECLRLGRKNCNIKITYLTWIISDKNTSSLTIYLLKFVSLFARRTLSKIALRDLKILFRPGGYILGTYAMITEKIRELEDMGVSELIIYFPIVSEEVIENFTKHVIDKV